MAALFNHVTLNADLPTKGIVQFLVYTLGQDSAILYTAEYL